MPKEYLSCLHYKNRAEFSSCSQKRTSLCKHCPRSETVEYKVIQSSFRTHKKGDIILASLSGHCTDPKAKRLCDSFAPAPCWGYIPMDSYNYHGICLRKKVEEKQMVAINNKFIKDRIAIFEALQELKNA